jgi:hypothetical protein
MAYSKQKELTVSLAASPLSSYFTSVVIRASLLYHRCEHHQSGQRRNCRLQDSFRHQYIGPRLTLCLLILPVSSLRRHCSIVDANVINQTGKETPCVKCISTTYAQVAIKRPPAIDSFQSRPATRSVG